MEIDGIIHQEFVPVDEYRYVNAAFYDEVLTRLLRRIQRFRQQLAGLRSGSWVLLHNNAPSHSAIFVRQFLAQRDVTVLDHPPYSPDQEPAELFLFSRMEEVLKEARFADVSTIQRRVTSVLRSIPKEAFSDSFQKLYERCQKGVVYNGDYFEGQ